MQSRLFLQPQKHVRRAPTFSEREKLTHLLPRLSQAEKFPLLLEQLDKIHMAVVVESVDGQLRSYTKMKKE